MIHSNYFFNSAMSPSTFKQKKSAMVILIIFCHRILPPPTRSSTTSYCRTVCLSYMLAMLSHLGGLPGQISESRTVVVVSLSPISTQDLWSVSRWFLLCEIIYSIDTITIHTSNADLILSRCHRNSRNTTRPPARHYDESRSPRRCRVQQYRDLLVPEVDPREIYYDSYSSPRCAIIRMCIYSNCVCLSRHDYSAPPATKMSAATGGTTSTLMSNDEPLLLFCTWSTRLVEGGDQHERRAYNLNCTSRIITIPTKSQN